MKRSTIKDVARAAGVNAGTVSRALAGKEHVAQDTRARILAAVEALAYRPNALARAMITQRTQVLAMLAPSLTDPLFEAMVGGAEAVARQAGYTVLVAGAEAVESGFLHEHPVDGLLILDPLRFQPHLAHAPSVPVVTMDDAPMDDLGGGRLIGEHLRDLGHTRALALGGLHDSPYAAARHRGLLESFPGTPWQPGDWTPEGGHALATRADLAGVTAVVCLNDLNALGVLAALRERGLRVPQDLSVVGFDDEPFARYLDPPLTTVRQDFHGQSLRLTRLLLERIGGAGLESLPVTPLGLVTRASTAPAAGVERSQP